MSGIDLGHVARGIIDTSRIGGSVAVFVGPGVSMRAGIPSFYDLIRDAAARLYEDSSVEVREYVSSHGIDEFKDLLVRQMRGQTLADMITAGLSASHANVTDLHRAIAELPSASYITTNFDDLLERALRRTRKRYRIVATDADLAKVSHTEPSLIKLCGIPDRPETLRLSIRSYDTAPDRDQVDSHVRSIMATRLTLFVGFEAASQLLAEIYERFWSRPTLGFDWVLLDSGESPFARTLWEDRGVKVVNAAKADEADFIRAFGRSMTSAKDRGGSLAMRPRRHKRRIFISAPMESAWVARRLSESLETSGFEVSSAFSSTFRPGLTLAEQWQDFTADIAAAIVLLPEHTDVRRIRSNVIFEIGYLMGKLGRDRVLVITPPGSGGLPSDLLETQMVMSESPAPQELVDTVATWAAQLR